MSFARKLAPLGALLVAAMFGLGACTSSGAQSGSQSGDQPYVDRNPSIELPEVTGEAGSAPSITTVDADPPTDITVKLLDAGDGDLVEPDDIVTVEYAGFLWDDGTQFDSSYTTDDAAIFSLNNVIEGWKWGLAGQHVGDRVELIVPADYGYGDTETSSIPANSTLVFIVEILDNQAVNTSALTEATETGEELPDGIIVEGAVGAQAILGYEEGVEAPTEEVQVVIREGHGQTITESDTVIYHYTGSYWGDSTATYTTWTTGPLVVSASGSAMLGYNVGSRILYVFPASDDTEAQVLVVDILGTYASS